MANRKDSTLLDSYAPDYESLDVAAPASKEADPHVARMLLISFCSMIVVGVGNRIFSVLMYSGGMNDYPLFCNLLTTFAYLPVSLLYIIPLYRKLAVWEVPQKVWMVMGTLDSLASIMQSLSIANLSTNGTLVTLLLQSAVPFSMVITKLFLKTKYRISQYVGAAVVLVGLGIVLSTSFGDDSGSGGSVLLWAAVLMGSCIPMTLSSVYKEKALGDREIDPVLMNFWVAVYQFIICFPLLVPSGYATGVAPSELGSNLLGGMKCWVGINPNSSEDCSTGPIFTNIYILFNLAYNVLIILILKFGSSNILWMCMTLNVPITSLIFAIPGLPNYAPITWSVGVGLPVIMGGLVAYRFWPQIEGFGRKMLGYEQLAAEEAS